MHARPHFVRCLRANATETPMLFERATVAKQVSTESGTPNRNDRWTYFEKRPNYR